MPKGKKKEAPVGEKRRHFFEAAKWWTQARQAALAWSGDDLMLGMDLSLNSTGIASCSLSDFRKLVETDWADPSPIKTMAARWPKDTTTRQKINGLGEAMVGAMMGRKVFSIAYESVTVTQDPSSFKALALCNGALYMAAAPETLLMQLVTTQIKKIAAGKAKKLDDNGEHVTISKADVIAGLNANYNGLCDKLAIKTDDEADALCALLANGYMSLYLESLSEMLAEEYSEAIVFAHEKSLTKGSDNLREKSMRQVLYAVLTSPTTWGENENTEHKKVLAAIKASRPAPQAVDGRSGNRKAASARVLQEKESAGEDLDMLSQL